MEADIALMKIRRILEDSVDIYDIAAVIKEYYKNEPQSLDFIFWDEDDWPQNFDNPPLIYPLVFVRSDKEMLSPDQEQLVSRLLPEDYSFCMESVVECETIEQDNKEAGILKIIKKLEECGIRYVGIRDKGEF